MQTNASWNQIIGKPFVPTIYVATTEGVYTLMDQGTGDNFDLKVQGRPKPTLESALGSTNSDSEFLYTRTIDFNMSNRGIIAGNTLFHQIASALAYATICDRENAIDYVVLRAADESLLRNAELISALGQGNDLKIAKSSSSLKDLMVNWRRKTDRFFSKK
ncbi:hypothetical protein JW949_02015, partial [Candidatus Woesearchaeota archaeon]|nr:hypothetical protein [Candidatus Woesearchaeota archaeon]